jgi:hypothetical protein
MLAAICRAFSWIRRAAVTAAAPETAIERDP